MSLQIHVKRRVMLPALSGAERSSDACLRSHWMAAVCSSRCGAGSIISVKALRASACNLIFKPLCSQLPRGSCAFSLRLFICLHLCSGVTLSSPSHLNTLRLQLLMSSVTMASFFPPSANSERLMSTYGPCLTHLVSCL